MANLGMELRSLVKLSKESNNETELFYVYCKRVAYQVAVQGYSRFKFNYTFDKIDDKKNKIIIENVQNKLKSAGVDMEVLSIENDEIIFILSWPENDDKI